MELSEAIKARRSVRKYIDKKLDKSTIEDILNYGILAPSAHNKQPWEFVVVMDEDLKGKIAKSLKEVTDVPTNMTSEAINGASTLVLVFGNIEDEVMDIESIGAAIENICLRSTDLGVSSLWIGYILKIEDELKGMFNKKNRLIAAVALGYSDGEIKPRPRVALEEKAVWY